MVHERRIQRGGLRITVATKVREAYRVSPERLEEIKTLLSDNSLSDVSIADKLGIPHQNVYYWRKKLNILRDLTPYAKQIRTMYLDEKKSVKDISDALDISYNKLYRFMIAQEIPLRSYLLKQTNTIKEPKRAIPINSDMEYDERYPNVAKALAEEIQYMAKEKGMSEQDFRAFMDTKEGYLYCMRHSYEQ